MSGRTDSRGLEGGRLRRAKKQKLGHSSRKRVRVAAVALLAMACALGLLALQSKVEHSPDTMGVTQYLLSGDRERSDDPLSLTATVPGLEVTGVTADGSVVGYASNEPVRQTCSRLSLALQSDGWALESDDGQGLLNFTKLSAASQQLADALEARPQTLGLFVQCVPVGEGSAVVVSRW